MTARDTFFNEQYFRVYGNDPRRQQMYRVECRMIESLVPSGRILDVGCGIGAFLDEFSSTRWEKYGVDVSDFAIAAARAKGIRVNDLDNSYNYPEGFFDVVVFRGSLQHLPCPFKIIQDCIRLMVPGGIMAFLATPNTNSPYFRRFKTLPFLTLGVSILQPSDIMMRHALQNFGLDIVDIRYPYLDTPYARPLQDHLSYLLSFLGVRRNFPFWRSSMEIYARKPVA
jgi:SAM-dependent methyltransferase